MYGTYELFCRICFICSHSNYQSDQENGSEGLVRDGLEMERIEKEDVYSSDYFF
jgi:hypothetical protein